VTFMEQIDQAFALDDHKTHRAHAASRDAMLALIEQHPEVFDTRRECNLRLIRGAAERCGNVGPFKKAIELYRKLVLLSNNATDWYKLSEVLTHGDYFEESLAALEKAMELAPNVYDTPASRETLMLARNADLRA